MNKIHLSWEEFDSMVNQLVEKIKISGKKFDSVCGIPRGGLPIAVCISHRLDLPLTFLPKKNTLIVDDISDNGKTLESHAKKHKIATLYTTSWSKTKPDWYVGIKESQKDWIVFPWENPSEQ
mgnify:CR=1 FL=1